MQSLWVLNLNISPLTFTHFVFCHNLNTLVFLIGHFTKDCFSAPGLQYALLPEEDDKEPQQQSSASVLKQDSDKKKKKKKVSVLVNYCWIVLTTVKSPVLFSHTA